MYSMLQNIRFVRSRCGPSFCDQAYDSLFHSGEICFALGGEVGHMVEKIQQLLKIAWLGGKKGSLGALAEARAWALREVWQADEKPEYGMLLFVSEHVTKVGGGNPSPQAISQLFERIDDDTAWFPGKRTQEQYGPKPILSGAKRLAVANCAMAIKGRGHEPTYARVVASCKDATLNPSTGKSVSKKRVYEVFRKDCFDEGAEHPWEHTARYSKVALTEPMMLRRMGFATFVHGWGHTGLWFHNHVVWTDICNSILPRTEKKASAQALARKGPKGWGSKGCELYSCNLKGKKEDIKQNSWDCIKVWWAPMLMRGKLHVEVFDEGFPGETPEGAEQLVAKVRSAVNCRFQGDTTKPDRVMVDRGRGFYAIATGKITPQFQSALREHGLSNMMGDDASVQPGHMQEIMLHETAVAWIRLRLTRSTPDQCWLETRAEYGSRLKTVVRDINANLDVLSLCYNLPRRLEGLIAAEGGRLKE